MKQGGKKYVNGSTTRSASTTPQGRWSPGEQQEVEYMHRQSVSTDMLRKAWAHDQRRRELSSLTVFLTQQRSPAL